MVSIRRGDVFWTRFDPIEGSELAGLRPAVVVQNDVGNRFSDTTIVAGITTRFARKASPACPRGRFRRRPP
jgi:mRNA interferase MazF